MTIVLRKRPQIEEKNANRLIKKIETNNAMLADRTRRAQNMMEMATNRHDRETSRAVCN